MVSAGGSVLSVPGVLLVVNVDGQEDVSVVVPASELGEGVSLDPVVVVVLSAAPAVFEDEATEAQLLETGFGNCLAGRVSVSAGLIVALVG